jgi:hypothetical protein
MWQNTPNMLSRLVHWLQLAKHPQADEPDLPLRFRQPGLARERNLPEYARPVPHRELAKAVQLYGEAVRSQIVEQRVLDARDHGVDYALCFFLCGQTQSLLNPPGQLVPTSS